MKWTSWSLDGGSESELSDSKCTSDPESTSALGVTSGSECTAVIPVAPVPQVQETANHIDVLILYGHIDCPNI